MASASPAIPETRSDASPALAPAPVPAPAPTSAPESASAPEPTWPDPPRYWWLKRLTASVLLLTVALAAVRYAWGREAKRRLGRELEPIIAAGEPVSGPGMNPPPVPDAENGALLYLKAMTVFGTDSPAASSMEYPDHPPFPPRWHKMEDKSVATNWQVLSLVRKARGYSRFDWGIRVTTPSYAVAIPILNKARHLANLVGDAGLHAHVHGDDFEAIERVRDLRHAAAAIDGPPGFLVNHLVRVGIEALAIYRLEVMAPELTIAPDGDNDTPAPASTLGATQPSRRPATRAQVRALIAELLDERDQLRDSRRSLVSERAASLDLVEWLGSRGALLRPMFDLDAVRLARAGAALAKASTLPNSQAVKESLAAEPLLQQPRQVVTPVGPGARPPAGGAATQPVVDYTRILSTDVALTNFGRAIEQDIRVRMERRLAAVSLAVRLYRVDRAGAFPPSLEALVPKYLPQVPVDPAAADGRPLRYLIVKGGLPGGGDRPIVYSVGTDGLDRTAEAGPDKAGLPPQPQYGYWNGPDQWRDLTRWTPPRTAAEDAEDARQEQMAKPILDALDNGERRIR